jgi:two-component system response regulator HydG
MPRVSGIDLLRAARDLYPELPFLLVTAYADVRDAVTSLKLGAIDYLSKPVDLDELLAAVTDTLGLQHDPASAFDPPADLLDGIIAASPAMRATLRDAWRVASADATVLLTGESGVGKEVIARFIHRASPRARAPFIPLNCAASPGPLLASELFGHVKGAFSGAVHARNGHFKEAHTGTLFLDELGDMPLDLQPTLLRAIETRAFTPVGSDRLTHVDVRLLAATHHDLHDAVLHGRFRDDLYYRLNVIAIEIPPLRERPEDIAPLARALLQRANAPDKRLSSAALRALLDHRWPGNVRELANAMTRAALMARGDVILPEHLPPALRNPPPPPHDDDAIKTLAQAEVDMIKRALEQTSGNRTHAADLLGITRRGLIKKLKRLDAATDDDDDDDT